MLEKKSPNKKTRRESHWLARVIVGSFWLVLVAGFSVLVVAAIAVMVAFPRLPDLPELKIYRPMLPLRVYSQDNVLLGEFGTERRDYLKYDQIPAVMRNAVLSIEDVRFFEHNGVDIKGVVRASIDYIFHGGRGGASTITMQVARNFYLSTQRAFKRKFYEALLAMKIESVLSKEQILEIYMNQIFLGNRAYGFAAASKAYFGKDLAQISPAEAAMLAGLPKAPSEYNPLRNPKRATERQQYILKRMLENKFIDPSQYEEAVKQKLIYASYQEEQMPQQYSQFVAELVRQSVFDEFGDEAYSRGMSVYTTINFEHQVTAFRALRDGLMQFDKRQPYRGPERQMSIGDDPAAWPQEVAKVLETSPDSDVILAAVVTQVGPRAIQVMRTGGEELTIEEQGLRQARNFLNAKAGKREIKRGSVIRLIRDRSNPKKPFWQIVQLPEVEGALVSMEPQTGDIRALVGGFDYAKNKFNHVTQAWRQPGSSFKPFVYSAAIEKGVWGATIVNDAPIQLDTGAKEIWEPKNYEEKYDGPVPLHIGLSKSKNMVSIRVLDFIGTEYTQQWATKFGFDPTRNPPYLTLALGAGATTPMQMAQAYSVFANGGYRIAPRLITRIEDANGKLIKEFAAHSLQESERAISPRNAFVMNSLLNEVTIRGTGARATAELKRRDLYGKTGTTNDSLDAWFCGFQPSLTTVVWIGYDQPKKLGDRETGGGLALPVWIDYMRYALQDVPEAPVRPVGDVVEKDGSYVFAEFAGEQGIASIGVDDAGATLLQVSDQEREEMLKYFSNPASQDTPAFSGTH